MIKTLYRGVKNARDGDGECGWCLLFILYTTVSSGILATFNYWGLYLFSPLFGAQLTFFAWLIPVSWACGCFVLWFWYISQNQRGVFDLEKPKKQKKVKLSKEQETLNFINGIRQ